MLKNSDALDDLAFWISILGIPYETEYKFHPKRRWRFDFAFPNDLVAVEFEGGIYRKGGGWHQSIGRMEGDMEKYSRAALDGWIVLRFSADQVRKGMAYEMIEEALGLKE